MHRLVQTSIFRIALLYLLLLVVTLAVLLGFIDWSTAGLLERQTDETVQAEIRGLAEQYRDEGLVRLMEVIHQRSGPSGVAENVYLLTGPGYQPLAGNLANWPAAASAQEGWLEVKLARRAAERRVGQEGVSTCRSGWSPSYYTKQTLQN